MTIAIDFDGTVVEHAYPKIGRELPFATETLRMLIKDRHKLILWTQREGQLLQEALDWCKKRGVKFYAINSSYPEQTEEHNNFSRKPAVDYFIDDKCISGLPDWGQIYRIITEGITYEDLLRESMQKGIQESPKKRKFLFFKL